MAEIAGQCLCGAVSITVSDPVGWLGACHCRLCQRWSGGLWAGFPAAEETVSVHGSVQEYPSSTLANRAFCATCGTQLWMRNRESGAPYDLMPGIFEAAKGWPLKSEIYVDEALCAFALGGDHKRADAAAYRAKNPEAREVQHG
jgi:hypothetical protein